jgi:uncharacterized membrane protein (UPF0127 family)
MDKAHRSPTTRRLLPAFALIAAWSAPGHCTPVTAVELTNHTFAVELADTPQERASGLMHRPPLPPGTGMLFVYERPQAVRFWNKNVAFPIDILYFDDDHRLLRVDSRIPPCLEAECPTYRPQTGVRLVLELPGGTAEAIGATPGAQLRLLRPGP